MNPTRFLFILALLVSWIPARAANPTFESFDPLYFKTNGAAPHRIKGFFNPTQFVTNSTNGITIPDSAVIGLQYWTNVSGKLFPVTGGTNRFFIGPGATSTGTGTNYYGDDGAFHPFTFTIGTNVLWVEVGGVYSPAIPETTILLTNAVVAQALAVDGAFVEQGFSGAAANPGTNNLNPYRVGTFIVNSTTNNPAACIIDLSSGSGTGQLLAIEKGTVGSFTLQNAGLCWDDPSHSNILRYVDWVPTYAGETILLHQNQQGNWVEWGRSPQATNAIGTNVVAGDIFATNLYVTNINGVVVSNIIAGSSIWTNRSGTVGLINQALPVDLQAPLIWGPGTTNVLYRSGSQLVYTNGAVSGNGVNIQVINGNGYQALFGVDQDQVVAIAGTPDTIRLEPNNAGVVYNFKTAQVYPTLGHPSLGFEGATNYFGSLMAGTTNIWKFLGVTGTNPVVNVNGTNYTLGAGGGVSFTDSWSTNGSYLQPTDLTRGIFITNNIVWGPGNTNVMQRVGNGWALTNSGNPKFAVIDGTGRSIELSLTNGGNPTLQYSGGGNGLYLDGGTNSIAFMHGGSVKWYVGNSAGSGSLLSATDGGNDIGLVSNNRPAHVYTTIGFNITTNTITRSGTTPDLPLWNGAAWPGTGGSGIVFSTGTGSPEGAVSGSPGDMYYDTNTDFHYQKITGSATTTGWGIF